MSMHSIEPGQRLKMQAGEKSGFVEVLAEAVVPAGYWICRDEISGQRRVVAATALFPLEDVAVAETPEVPGETLPSAA